MCNLGTCLLSVLHIFTFRLQWQLGQCRSLASDTNVYTSTHLPCTSRLLFVAHSAPHYTAECQLVTFHQYMSTMPSRPDTLLPIVVRLVLTRWNKFSSFMARVIVMNVHAAGNQGIYLYLRTPVGLPKKICLDDCG